MLPFLECARRHAELTRAARPAFGRLVAEVEQVAHRAAARPSVEYRVKGVLSTWVKVRRRRCPVEAVHDLLGVRVLVDRVEECYAVLAGLQARWTLHDEVEDYIREPKGSGYRSLHAVLLVEPGLLVEVQVRTRAMHRVCEHGRAAHRLYKRRQLATAAEPGTREPLAPPAWLEGIPWLGKGLLAGQERHGSGFAVRSGDRRANSGTTRSADRPPLRDARRDAATTAWAIALVALVGVLDAVSGFALDFSVFYLVPIGLASWSVGSRAGVLTASLSAAAWWAANQLTAPLQVHPLLVLWNVVMRLAVDLLVAQTLAALRRALDHQRGLLLTDQLTGVLSARGFFEVTQAHMEEAKRLGLPLTLAFVDLDDFKRVNDQLGHGPADALLHAWAQALRGSIRASDHLARLGGDEFAILLPDTSATQAREALARLHERLSVHAAGLPVPLTFSMGAVTFVSVPGSVDSMLHEADVLMYEAKAQGKNRWLFAEAQAESTPAGPAATPAADASRRS